MKAKRVSEHIWSLNIWMLIPVHVWVVVDKGEVTLVDAGIPSMAKGIINFIEKLNMGSLTRILLTHGHQDHIGAIKPILNQNKVPVFAHQIEIPYMTGELAYPKRKKPEQNVAKEIIQPLPEDIAGNLMTIGGLTPYHTPGHSPGHVAYFHEKDQVLLAGDLFTSKKGKLHRPMSIFTPDMNEAVKSSAIIKYLKPKKVEVCHGYTVLNPADHLEEYMEKTLAAIKS
ncbi:MBL fold metallo-hydrolase [Lederbergia wuyishanensis]|uniref:Glyoxylase-like metal-dependent hydrolase (Beta-lactamase superfamily II) n=1 Tax=Lederbergia wuyishanensis TaxID=1347903 RepID=A0ABU0D800_9BACI|nr:MBL fold metallo-hydrolase [Lederbergia wuyishanensis]MCJ8009348.1 MBL fold metallo-hydrolase [Lederbergia wuyishanensis]MDQ0344517.1 glyoxylase-like metal-dependent hydrolase (beta-lactamase superfamily II) [Lederbergia wuyishanensis]